jgi:hypothetical protein
MSNFSGSFSGRATSQTTIALEDIPNHDLNLLEVRGVQKTSDVNWKDAKITYWGTADLVDGNGPQRGYFVDVHANGDREVENTWEGTYELAAPKVDLAWLLKNRSFIIWRHIAYLVLRTSTTGRPQKLQQDHPYPI